MSSSHGNLVGIDKFCSFHTSGTDRDGDSRLSQQLAVKRSDGSQIPFCLCEGNAFQTNKVMLQTENALTLRSRLTLSLTSLLPLKMLAR
jgi:hypothetical protein